MKRVWKSIRNIIKTPWPSKEEEKKSPLVLSRDKHCISRKNIDQDALKVLYRLKRFGHTAYLVGGGVRDLLLGLPAKDFDIGTSARPGQVKKVFSNCRLIGRRFRLAHILFRGKFIEVSTFRKQSEFDIEKSDVLIRSDNTYGTPEEDAFRRDFTINGLFYNIADFTVIDYVDGLKDLDGKIIRSIGDPNIRFREDPIRMLRAIRLAARLGFEIEPDTKKAISSHRGEIWKGAAPRILEELHRMLSDGGSKRAMELLLETGLMEMLLPELTIVLLRRGQAPTFWKYMETIDEFIAGGKAFTFPVLYATLMTCLYRSKVENTKGQINLGALVEESIYPIAQRLGVPKRNTDRAKAILIAQRRLFNISRRGFHAGSLIGKPYFPEALDLFQIHAAANQQQLHLYKRWEKLLGKGPEERKKKPARKRYYRRRKPRKKDETGH